MVQSWDWHFLLSRATAQEGNARMMALVKAGEQIQHLLLPQTDQKKSLLLSISQCQDYAWPHNLWPHTRVLSAMQHQGVTAVEGQCVCAHTNA